MPAVRLTPCASSYRSISPSQSGRRGRAGADRLLQTVAAFDRVTGATGWSRRFASVRNPVHRYRPHARRELEVRSARCREVPPNRYRLWNGWTAFRRGVGGRQRLGRRYPPKVSRESDGLGHFHWMAGSVRLHPWHRKNWRDLPTLRSFDALPPLRPLRWPSLETSLRPQFRTDETAGTRQASSNGVRCAHAHTAAGGHSRYSDRARLQPWLLLSNSQSLRSACSS